MRFGITLPAFADFSDPRALAELARRLSLQAGMASLSGITSSSIRPFILVADT
jgi:hypothetical protein